jgi:KaiC/GvpD/RAD55 family RecA-like ATPase/DNA repair exonuclease SbcCD ATPase subunit
VVGRVTRVNLKRQEQALLAPGKPSELTRYLAVLKHHRHAPRRQPSRKTAIEGQQEVHHDEELRQKAEAGLRRAEDELKALRAGGSAGGAEGGTNLEEELRAKEEELNRIKNDYATKMKNSLALQRIKYEREIDNLRKEARKLNMGREESNDDMLKREKELSDKESAMKAHEMELNELKKKLESGSVPGGKEVKVLVKDHAMEEKLLNFENEMLRLKTSLDVKGEALKQSEDRLTAKEKEFEEFRKAVDDSTKNADLKSELDNVKKGSIAMMKYITNLQQKKQEEEFKALRKALENEIQKRLGVEEELRKKEASLAARQRALGAEIEKVAGSKNVDLQMVKRLEEELRAREAEVTKKEELISSKEQALVDRIKGLEGEIQKKLRDGKLLQDIKREFALKEEELNLLRTELQQKEDELRRREGDLSRKGGISGTAPAAVPAAVEAELRKLRDELAFKDADYAKMADKVKMKDAEFMRREEDLRYQSELNKREILKIEEARKEHASVEEVDLKKRLEVLEQAIKNKEEEIKSRETYLRKKEEELRIRESKAIATDVESRQDELRLEIQTEKAKTGNARLDDLLMGGIPFGSNLLVIGPAFIGKEVLINRFLIEGLQKGIPALICTTDISPIEIRDEMNAIAPGVENFEKMGLLRYIDVYSKSMGLVEEDPYTTYVEHPTDYTGITKAVELITKGFKEKHETYRMAVRSISTLVTYSDPTSTYKFLQVITGRAKRAKVVAMYTMDRGMHSETDIQTLAHQMDGSVEFKTDGVKTFLTVQGLSDVQSRSWIQYNYTKKGLNIGSFALDHIR